VEPVEDLRLLAPECRGIREGLLVEALVLVETLDVRAFPDVRRDVVDIGRQGDLRRVTPFRGSRVRASAGQAGMALCGWGDEASSLGRRRRR